MPESASNFNDNPNGSLGPGHNLPVYSVSEVSTAIKRTVEDRFGVVRVRGEISGWKQATSGHVYFRLKDDGAVIDAVCWRGTAGRLSFKPEDGLEVVASGKVTTYPGKSSYQIVVDRMEPAGAGALMALLEKRRKMFEAEGLFDPKRKKPLPFLPQVVGVITSPTGAVIRDILHRIGDRFPVRVLVWPVAVQGEGAAEQVAAAIRGFNNLSTPVFSAENTMSHGSGLARSAIVSPPESTPVDSMGYSSGLARSADLASIPRPDVLIVARGGGSIEDLWAFNEEVVVRAAAESAIPLISAVGHETDTTLIDFVSSMRAPTPTAAAEMAVPVRQELYVACRQLDTRLQAAMLRLLSQRQDRLEGLARGLPRPMQLLQVASQRMDDWGERLEASLPALLTRKSQELSALSARLRPNAIAAEMQRMGQRVGELQQRLDAGISRMIAQRQDRLASLSAMLETVNYKSVLARGFVLVKDASGALVTKASQAGASSSLQLVFSDGSVQVTPQKS